MKRSRYVTGLLVLLMLFLILPQLVQAETTTEKKRTINIGYVRSDNFIRKHNDGRHSVYAYTELPDTIRKESDLISYIKEGGEVSCGGTLYHGTAREKMGVMHQLLVQSFLIYNVVGAMCRSRKRSLEIKKAELKI